MRSVKITLLFVAKALGFFSLARWATRSHLKILCYHGFELYDETAFRPKLFIKPACFEQRLKTIQRYGFQVLPLDEAVERLYAETLPDDALVITVDDGFHSFHRIAFPYLQRYQYPATVYVTTYYVRNPHPIFRLVVQYLFWKTRKSELKLQNVSWSNDCLIDLSNPIQTSQAMWDCIEYGERHCTEQQRHEICEQLGALLESPYEEVTRSKMFHLMTPNELQTLSASTISVNLHTHRHTFPIDDLAAAEREIADNRAALQQWLVGEHQHFCYPSGLWDERQWSVLDKLQVKSSVTCVPGLNFRNTPRHELKRFLDSDDIHQLEFEAAVSGFSDLVRSFLVRT